MSSSIPAVLVHVPLHTNCIIIPRRSAERLLRLRARAVMSSSVVAALEAVDKLRKQIEGLRKEVRELEVQLTIARGAAKSAVQERDFQLKQVSQLTT